MFLSALLSVRAWADTAYIPPESPQSAITRTASGQGVDYRTSGGTGPSTTNFKGGSWSVGADGSVKAQFSGAAKSGAVHTATKTHPATFTGTYGEKAAGTVKTQTTLPQQSALSRAFGTMAVGAMATSHHQSLQRQGVAEQISRGFSDGDWGAVAAGIGKAFDWTGIGGIYAQALYGNPDIQQQVINPMHQQALAQAQQQFEAHQQRQQLNPDDFRNYKIVTLQAWTPLTINNNKVLIAKVAVPASFNQSLQRQAKDVAFVVTLNGVNYSIPDIGRPGDPTWVSLTAKPATRQDIIDINAAAAPPLQNILPTEAQWAAAMERFLNSSQATNEAVRDLINAIWANGGLNPQNTQTTVIGGDTSNTFLSAPYTPAGAQTAQQTRFVVAPNGTVATSYVQRPDLGAHTSQAPTRSPVGQVRKRPDIDIDIDGGSGSDDKEATQKVEICEEDDEGKLVCLEAGSDDYEDLELPKNEISLEFERKEYFDDGGSCPADPSFNVLGHTFTLSYKHICKVADMVSPMMELAGIVTAAGIAYAAVREL